MDVPEGKQRVSKQQGATIQVEAAIDALMQGNFIVAITLAGAAEGMIETDAKDMFQAIINVPAKERKAWISTINGERDWLKHPTTGDPRKVLEPGSMDAGFSKFDAAI